MEVNLRFIEIQHWTRNINEHSYEHMHRKLIHMHQKLGGPAGCLGNH